MQKMTLPILGAASLMLTATAVMAQPQDPDYTPTAPPTRLGPSPGEQHDMHTGAANTNGSSSVAYDRYGAHADGFPKIRLAENGGFEGRNWRYNHHRRHHPRRDNGGD